MSDGTKIEWCNATANVINGCTIVSPGCTNCYAMKQAHRFPVRQGLTKQSHGGMVWTGEVRFHEPALQQVLRWKRPRRIFWNAHGDTFHESVPDEWIDRCFAAMALTPQHTHQVLTKRPERMREYLSSDARQDEISFMAGVVAGEHGLPELDALKAAALIADQPLPNVWLGTSVEDQKRADERIPILLDTPAAVRWISAEPLLGPVDLYDAGAITWDQEQVGHGEDEVADFVRTGLDWVVAGGESGPGARPMHPDWARSLRDQCEAAGVPFLFKQWGAFAQVEAGPAEWESPPRLNASRGRITVYPDGTRMGRGFFPIDAKGCVQMNRVSKKEAGRLLDGVEHNGYPQGAQQ